MWRGNRGEDRKTGNGRQANETVSLSCNEDAIAYAAGHDFAERAQSH